MMAKHIWVIEGKIKDDPGDDYFPVLEFPGVESTYLTREEALCGAKDMSQRVSHKVYYRPVKYVKA